MRTLLVAVALVAVAFAGCADSAASLQNVSEGLKPRAETIVGGEVQLYMVAGIEPSEEIPADDNDGCGTIPRDSNPGDGRASAWIYVYSDGVDSVGIVTDRNGKFRCEVEEDFGDITSGVPLTEWKVEAPEAASIIRDNVEGYAELVAGGDVLMLLSGAPDGPMWMFMLFNEDMAMWAVDAMTGEFMADFVPPQLGGTALPEGGASSGQSIGTLAVWLYAAAPFTLESSGHATLELIIQSDEPGAMLLPYGVTVVTPNGNEEQFSVQNGDLITLADPMPGDYVVRIQPAAAGVASFTVTYCAYTDIPCGQDGARHTLGFL